MPLPTRITLPPSGRPVGGLLSAARPIGGDWWRGVKFTSGQCLSPQVVGTCTDGEVAKTLGELSGEASFDAFAVVQALRCSTMGQAVLSAYTTDSLDVTREFAVAGELLSGLGSGNPSLADATVLGAASDAVSALACLEQQASTSLSGRLVFFHASAELATVLLQADVIWRDGRLWRTVLGNVVVVSPGYDARAPGTDPIAEGDELFLYATGEVYAEVGQREVFQSVERSQNSLETIAEDAALVIFDPCLNLAVGTGIEHCNLEAIS